MFVAVELASSGMRSLQRTKAAAPPVRMFVRKRATGMLALKLGDVSGSRFIIIAALILFPFSTSESDWFPVAAQTHCCGEKYRGHHQPDPHTRRAEKFSRSELSQGANGAVRVEGESLHGEAHEAVLQHGGEMRAAEGNLLEGGDREKRQYGPEKCCTPRPA